MVCAVCLSIFLGIWNIITNLSSRFIALHILKWALHWFQDLWNSRKVGSINSSMKHIQTSTQFLNNIIENFGNISFSSMGSHGILFWFKVPCHLLQALRCHGIPWHFMELWKSELHGNHRNSINLIFSNNIFPNFDFGILPVIMRYLEKKSSQKCCILRRFQ